MRCRVFDCCRDLLWMGDVHRVARTEYLDRVTVGSLCIPPLEFEIDGSVRPCYQHPTRLGPPRRSGDHGFKFVGEIWHLRPCHECGLRDGKIGREIFVELGWIKESKAVRRFLDPDGFTEIAREPLSIFCFTFAGIM